jgi:hypothetical protein
MVAVLTQLRLAIREILLPRDKPVSHSETATATTTPTPTPVPVKLKISPKSLKFGTVTVGSRKGLRNVTLTNPKGSKKEPGLTVLMEGFSGGANPYAVTDGCKGGLRPRGQCTIGVTFTPDPCASAKPCPDNNRQCGRASIREARGQEQKQIEKGLPFNRKQFEGKAYTPSTSEH